MRNLKVIPTLLGLMLLNANAASASDTTGALIVVPIGGGILGVLTWAMWTFLRFRLRGKRTSWFTLPLFVIAGCIVFLAVLIISMRSLDDKIVHSIGNYDRYRGGMGVIGVPEDFSTTELEQFYSLITNRKNPILTPYKFAAALIHQDNGIVQVYLNVYPELDIAEYEKVNDEVRRQMDTILERGGHGRDTRK